MTTEQLLRARTRALERVTRTKDGLIETLDKAAASASLNATGARAVGRLEEERRWLDVLAILERRPTP